MRKLAIILCVIGQLSVLIYMSAGREHILQNGQRVFVQTAPIDPRDIFRGDFVRLNYAFNQLPTHRYAGAELIPLKKGQVIFAALDKTAGDVYQLSTWNDSRPTSGVFIKGRLTLPYNPQTTTTARAKFGIEQFFVQQGAGLAIEDQRGQRGEMQVPMEIEAAIGKQGTAVIKGFRWAPMGIQLEVLQDPENTDNTEPSTQVLPARLSPRIRITLKNESDEAMGIYNPGDNCAFTLVAATPWFSSIELTDSSCEQLSYDDKALTRLQPGEHMRTEFDFSDARWLLQITDKEGGVTNGEIGKIAQFQLFRLVYRSPLSDDAIWPGELSSQGFNARGRVD